MVETIDNIQNDYNSFLEYIYIAHSLFTDLYSKTNDFLQDYCKKEEYDKEFAYNLEIVSLNIERILFDFNNLLEEAEKVSFPKIEIHKKEKKVKNNPWKEVLLFYPKDYDKDIYVDSNSSIDWKKIIVGSNKPKTLLKLYRNNKGIK